MNQTLNKKKFKRYLIIFLKVVIFLATIYYIRGKIKGSADFDNFFDQFTGLNLLSLMLLAIVFLAMLVNWGFESVKWKLLVSGFEKITFFKAFKAVWSGTSFNNWIPNRLGEFFGRILFIRYKNRPMAIFASLLGNAAQWLMTFGFGCTGLLIFIYSHRPVLFFPLLILSVVVITGFVWLFFQSGKIHKLNSRFKIIRLLTRYSKVFSWFSQKDLLLILLLSFGRYLTYLMQYYLLLLCFGVDAKPVELLSSVALIFLVQAIIPSFLLTETGIRGATVLYFTGMYSSNINAMLAAAYTLWLINLLIPSFFGSFFILFYKNKTSDKVSL